MVKAHELVLQYCVEHVDDPHPGMPGATGNGCSGNSTSYRDMDPLQAWYDAVWTPRDPWRDPQNGMLSVNRHRIVIKV